MVAQINPTNIKAAFALELAEADALTDEMIDCLPPAEAFALEYTLLYIENQAADGETTDLAACRPIYEHALFTARVAAGDPDAIRIYEAGIRYQKELEIAINAERILFDLFAE